MTFCFRSVDEQLSRYLKYSRLGLRSYDSISYLDRVLIFWLCTVPSSLTPLESMVGKHYQAIADSYCIHKHQLIFDIITAHPHLRPITVIIGTFLVEIDTNPLGVSLQ